MTGQTEILVALIAVTIVLAAIFLVRPTITAGATGKVLAFVALCILPVLCIDAGVSAHMQRSEQTEFCISCHSMETHGQSLYVDDPNYIPAYHFQNHLVPANQACYACHTDYTIFGPLKDKLQGMKRVYMQYVSTPPKVIQINGTYSNANCLHCHAGARGFIENPIHSAMMDSLTSDQVSCITSGCHDTIHNVSQLGSAKMWRPGQ